MTPPLTLWERLQQENPLEAAPFVGWYSQKYADRYGYAVWTTPGGDSTTVTCISPWHDGHHHTQWEDILLKGPVLKQLQNFPTEEARAERNYHRTLDLEEYKEAFFRKTPFNYPVFNDDGFAKFAKFRGY